jgi:hypothetical protein
MGGPPLYPGDLINIYTGGAERGLSRVVVRADPRVARVRVQLGRGERIELLPLASRPDIGVSFFAALFPPTAGLVSVTGLDAGGVLEPQDLTGHPPDALNPGRPQVSITRHASPPLPNPLCRAWRSKRQAGTPPAAPATPTTGKTSSGTTHPARRRLPGQH